MAANGEAPSALSGIEKLRMNKKTMIEIIINEYGSALFIVY